MKEGMKMSFCQQYEIYIAMGHENIIENEDKAWTKPGNVPSTVGRILVS